MSKRIFQSSCFASRSAPSRSVSERARTSLMSMLEALLHDELRVDRQLVAGEAHRLPRLRLGNARHLEHHPAGLDDRDPVVRRALARAHSDLGGLLGDRLVREDPDPDATTALDVV